MDTQVTPTSSTTTGAPYQKYWAATFTVKIAHLSVHCGPPTQPNFAELCSLAPELKGDAVVGLREIYIALARFIIRRLSFTVGDYVPAFRVKLGAMT